MKRSKVSISLGAAVLALSACGGTSVTIPDDLTKNKPLLEVLQDENSGLERTNVADLRGVGNASYAGFAQIFNGGSTIDLPVEVVGVADLKVGFANGGSLTGTLSGFDDPFSEYSGTLTVSNGAIGMGANGPQVSGDVAGTLTRDNGDAYVISGGVTGDFFGANGEYLNGADTVTVTQGGQSDTLEMFINAAELP